MFSPFAQQARVRCSGADCPLGCDGRTSVRDAGNGRHLNLPGTDWWAFAAAAGWEDPDGVTIALNAPDDAQTAGLARDPVGSARLVRGPHLDAALPLTSSFPSGHTAAAICRYGGVAAVVLRAVQVWWRWLVLGLAVLVIVAVAVGRLYRGAHYPTHVVGSVVFAVPWLLVTTKVCAPSGDQRVGPDQPVGSATSP